MALIVPPSAWRPHGGVTLEDAADRIVRSYFNMSVAAGPGAGKTELLAQRAGFLLETGTCPPPRRILAVCFKKDAARNLQNRVRQRCGVELSRRFDSLTYEAFAKGLIDRFLVGLPEQWRPSEDYELTGQYDRYGGADFLNSLKVPPELGRDDELRAMRWSDFMLEHVLKQRLGNPVVPPVSAEEWGARQLWRYLLKGRSKSQVFFPMLGRLAELLLRENEPILQALRATYSHVFLDEFQDTTYTQYDLVVTAFLGSRAVVTAVGDNKQRIMTWAGARSDAFDRFDADFGAKREALTMNFRSAPELVRIQQFLIEHLDPECPPPMPYDDGAAGGGQCRLLTFADPDEEACMLAVEIEKCLTEFKLKPRDICVLAKQRTDTYGEKLIAALGGRGIKARDEREMQDLLAEPIVDILLDLFKIVALTRAGSAWARSVSVLQDLRGLELDGDAVQALEAELSRKCEPIAAALPAVQFESDLHEFLRSIVGLVGENALRMEFPQYNQGAFFDLTVKKMATMLWKSFSRTNDWPTAIVDFEGSDSLPVMTIHMSKGLEYHTVIFVGLEDAAFWSFSQQAYEDTCAFFVAFSRARKQVIFTFCARRATRGYMETQKRSSIGTLYTLLANAGIKPQVGVAL